MLGGLDAFESWHGSVCVANPEEPDCPIVYSNPAFAELTGYGLDEIVGRNCRFLQGPETDRKTVREIHQAVAQNQVLMTCLLNYRADGTTFHNLLMLQPLELINGKQFIVGCQYSFDYTSSAFEMTKHICSTNEKINAPSSSFASAKTQIRESLEMRSKAVHMLARTYLNQAGMSASQLTRET